MVKQDPNSAQLFFKVPTIIEELSLGLTLGLGYIMETEISSIGMIRNEIRAM